MANRLTPNTVAPPDCEEGGAELNSVAKVSTAREKDY
jgi:hypothetical protein